MSDTRDRIFELFRDRSCTKQDVFSRTQQVFDEVKQVLQKLADDYQSEVSAKDERVQVTYEDRGAYEARIRFGGDVLVFHMHSNVFSFDKAHHIWNTSYVKEDPLRAYCGVINIYNFLSDSFVYNRENDMGYLVSRLFINKDRHCFVEGKRELNYLFKDFVNAEITETLLTTIVESSILYALKFDLYTPPFDKVQVVTVNQMKALSQNNKLRTGKRIGFPINAQSKRTL